MKRIFLSVSIPLPNRDPKYLETADVIAIREAVKGLVAEAILCSRVVFGGHPAITPLIALLLRGFGRDYSERVMLYRSTFFEGKFPRENDEFLNVVSVAAVGDSEDQSVDAMRRRMIRDQPCDVGVFIGGMEGVRKEFDMFRESYPYAPVWPIASTGAAALEIFDFLNRPRPDLFLEELTYPTLFRKLLQELPTA